MEINDDIRSHVEALSKFDAGKLQKALENAGESDRIRANLQDEANQATIENRELLKEIAENTAYLKKIVEINRETQLNAEELNHIMRAIYDVGKANNKKEADTLFSSALQAINSSGETAGNIANLVSLLMGFYNAVNNY